MSGPSDTIRGELEPGSLIDDSSMASMLAGRKQNKQMRLDFTILFFTRVLVLQQLSGAKDELQ